MRRTSRATARAAVTTAVAACLSLGAIGTATGAGTATAAGTATGAGTAIAAGTATGADTATGAGTATGVATSTGPSAGAPGPADRAAARRVATAPATLETLSRFFARYGAVSKTAAAPRVEGTTVPVHTLAPEFVAGKAGAPVAKVEFLASRAVSSDGQQASLWTARQGGQWQVVNIATGDDEFRYARLGDQKLPGGTVFREPQIDAWYVNKGTKVLPLDEDAMRAVGSRGTTLTAYQARVRAAYADKLPGSAYAKKGGAGGYAVHEENDRNGGVTFASAAAGAGALAALALCGPAAVRLRRRA